MKKMGKEKGKRGRRIRDRGEEKDNGVKRNQKKREKVR